eukprot:c12797_g1_i1.p1 GENE.c12797_g1_i1~~c12797_g1_i1.p1  ORF type:complete len:308 (+),score=61.97 c12797_g1_i1:33-956(+)
MAFLVVLLVASRAASIFRDDHPDDETERLLDGVTHAGDPRPLIELAGKSARYPAALTQTELERCVHLFRVGRKLVQTMTELAKSSPEGTAGTRLVFAGIGMAVKVISGMLPPGTAGFVQKMATMGVSTLTGIPQGDFIDELRREYTSIKVRDDPEMEEANWQSKIARAVTSLGVDMSHGFPKFVGDQAFDVVKIYTNAARELLLPTGVKEARLANTMMFLMDTLAHIVVIAENLKEDPRSLQKTYAHVPLLKKHTTVGKEACKFLNRWRPAQQVYDGYFEHDRRSLLAGFGLREDTRDSYAEDYVTL